jgi:hypothetical protein
MKVFSRKNRSSSHGGGSGSKGRKARNALLGGLCSVPAGLFVLVAAAFLVGLVAGGADPVFCETLVSGAVSGEWTRDGNPYVVTDSTWVPEGERLTIYF